MQGSTIGRGWRLTAQTLVACAVTSAVLGAATPTTAFAKGKVPTPAPAAGQTWRLVTPSTNVCEDLSFGAGTFTDSAGPSGTYTESGKKITLTWTGEGVRDRYKATYSKKDFEYTGNRVTGKTHTKAVLSADSCVP
jgi:hypothetical protein